MKLILIKIIICIILVCDINLVSASIFMKSEESIIEVYPESKFNLELSIINTDQTVIKGEYGVISYNTLNKKINSELSKNGFEADWDNCNMKYIFTESSLIDRISELQFYWDLIPYTQRALTYIGTGEIVIDVTDPAAIFSGGSYAPSNLISESIKNYLHETLLLDWDNYKKSVSSGDFYYQGSRKSVRDAILIPPTAELEINLPVKSTKYEGLNHLAFNIDAYKTYIEENPDLNKIKSGTQQPLNFKDLTLHLEIDINVKKSDKYVTPMVPYHPLSPVKEPKISSDWDENLSTEIQTTVEVHQADIHFNSEEALYWYKQGIDLGQSGNYAEAIKAFDNVLMIEPEIAEAWNNKGIALEEIGSNIEAIKCFDAAIKIDPENEIIYANKGLVLLKLEEYEESIAEYEKAIEIKGDFVGAWNGKGIALNKAGRFEESIQAFDKAQEIDPYYKISWLDKSIALIRLGRFVDAFKLFSKSSGIAV